MQRSPFHRGADDGNLPLAKKQCTALFFPLRLRALGARLRGTLNRFPPENNFGPSERTASTGPRANLRSRFAWEEDERRRDEESPGQSRGFRTDRSPRGRGADDGNRTHTASLGSWSSTTKLHLRSWKDGYEYTTIRRESQFFFAAARKWLCAPPPLFSWRSPSGRKAAARRPPR